MQRVAGSCASFVHGWSLHQRALLTSRPVIPKHRRRKRKAEPVAVAGLVHKVLEGMMGPERLREAEAVLAWPKAVGARVAARTEAERLVGDVLVVRVATAAYANELVMLKRMILEKLAPAVSGEPVREIRFYVGTLDA